MVHRLVLKLIYIGVKLLSHLYLRTLGQMLANIVMKLLLSICVKLEQFTVISFGL